MQYRRNRRILTTPATGEGLIDTRHDVPVQVVIIADRRSPVRAEITAPVPRSTGARLERTPSRLPILDEDVQALWKDVRTALPDVSLRSDGRTVRVRTGKEIHAEWLLDAMIEVVARMAHWDDGMMDALLELPDAHTIDGHRLTPAVMLPIDQLVVGVLDGRALVAELAGRDLRPATETSPGRAALEVTETGATLTWPRVVRDADAILDGVTALRAAVHGARPYR